MIWLDGCLIVRTLLHGDFDSTKLKANAVGNGSFPLLLLPSPSALC